MNIAFFAKMRSGKDTIAEHGIKEYGFYRFAFGDRLKQHYHDIFGNSNSKERSGYQQFGQFCRSINPNIWVDKCFNDIESKRIDYAMAMGKDGLMPIITDLRQPNEYERCKQEGFTFIKVHTDDEIRLQRMNAKGDNFTLEDLNHETESYIDTFEYDYLITNNGNLEYALHQFDQIYQELSKNDK